MCSVLSFSLKRQSFISFWLLLFSGLLTGSLQAQSDGQFALLLRFEGELRVERADGAFVEQPARGTRIFAGDTVQTGTASTALIIFPTNKTTLNVAADTRLTLNRHRFIPPAPGAATAEARAGTNETELTLDFGDIVGKVESLDRNAASHRFEVRTPVGVAGVRGTIFRIRYIPPAPGQPPVLTISTVQGVVVVSKVVAAGVTQNTQLSPEGEPQSTPAEESGMQQTEIPAGSEVEVLADINTETGEITVLSVESGRSVDAQTAQAITTAVEAVTLTAEETQILAQAEAEQPTETESPQDQQQSEEPSEESSEESQESGEESQESQESGEETPESQESQESTQSTESTESTQSTQSQDSTDSQDSAEPAEAEAPAPVAPLPDIQVENPVTPGAGNPGS